MELDELYEKEKVFSVIEQELNFSELYLNLEKVRLSLKQKYGIDLLNINDFSEDEEIDQYLKISSISKDIAYLDYLSLHKDRDHVKDYYVAGLYKSENGIKDILYYLKKLEEEYIKKPRLILNQKEYFNTLDLFSKSKEVYFSSLTDLYDTLNIFVAKNIFDKYKSKSELIDDLIMLSLVNKVYLISENMLKANTFLLLYYFY